VAFLVCIRHNAFGYSTLKQIQEHYVHANFLDCEGVYCEYRLG